MRKKIRKVKDTAEKGGKADLTKYGKAHILSIHHNEENKPDKTEFPSHWSNDDILHHVSNIATDPSSTSDVSKWDSPYVTEMRSGIKIRVDFYPSTHLTLSGKISTTYPTNVPPPPKNHNVI
ncbi:EndoU domain-containing protein [Pectobacterium wasabiae]|uniref:EndoU domain-containing protein n=1 Tax=Pectobacterium wasabiae TaxID=55208 RepID=UPI0008FB4A1F|nr:EndoU domain-containing protein [Pectobacterium wasabiae]